MPQNGRRILLSRHWPPPLYPKAFSLVDKHLFLEIACNARNFFAAVHAIPCANAKTLADAEADLRNRYQRAEAALSRAANVAIRTKLVLSQLMPSPVAEAVLSYLRA